MFGINNASKLNINRAHDFVTNRGRDLQMKNPKGTCASSFEMQSRERRKENEPFEMTDSLPQVVRATRVYST